MNHVPQEHERDIGERGPSVTGIATDLFLALCTGFERMAAASYRPPEEGLPMSTPPAYTWPQILALSEDELNLAIDPHVDTTASWERTMALANRARVERVLFIDWHYWVGTHQFEQCVRVPWDAEAQAHRVAICRLALYKACLAQLQEIPA